MGILRNIAKRAAGRVIGQAKGPGSGSGTGFGKEQDAAFAQLDHEADGAFQLVGAALVGTWEVAITDVGRALDGKIDEAKRMEMVERFSDALVPVQQPLQASGHEVRAAIKDGVKHGLESGKLMDACSPMAHALTTIGAPFAEGWAKTTDYLGPIFEVLPDADAAQAEFLTAGPELAAAFDAHAAAFWTELQGLPSQPDLRRALCDALDTWRDAMVRSLETIIYARRQVIVDQAKQLA